MLILTMFLFQLGCDDQDTTESGSSLGTSQITQSDLTQANRLANAVEAGAIIPGSSSEAPSEGSADLGVLGDEASINQQAFRRRYGLADPTQDQLAQWEQYDARLTAYSNKDSDYLFLLLTRVKTLTQIGRRR
jgi:hypothetical protein